MSYSAKDYHLLFQASKLPLLFTDICLPQYDNQDSLGFSAGEACEWYIHADRLTAARGRASELYKDRESVEAFCAALDEAVVALRALPVTADTATFDAFIRESRKLFSEYSKFSPIYTDALFDTGSDTSELQTLVLERKDAYRLVINELYFEEGSLFKRFMAAMEVQHQRSLGELYFATIDQLRELLISGEFVPQGIDGDDYALTYQSGERTTCYGAQAASLITDFKRAVEPINAVTEVKGVSVSKRGTYTGTVVKVSMNYERLSESLREFETIEAGKVLVTETTVPEMVPLMSRSLAIVTNIGGMLSHAAIVSRELGIPCVIGTKIATQVFQDGDMVEVDADTGIVRIL